MKLIGIVLYLLILLLIGAVASRRMKDLRDYYAGGKRFGFWAAAFSSRATGESAWLLIGLTGMGAAVGAQALWVVARRSARCCRGMDLSVWTLQTADRPLRFDHDPRLPGISIARHAAIAFGWSRLSRWSCS